MTEMVKTIINNRWEIMLPEHRAAREEWPTWEAKRLEAIHDKIKSLDNPVMYYVGAEEGDMAALCQMWGARVALFEPNDKVWPNIKAIWEANELKYAKFYPSFCSDEIKGANLWNQHLDFIEGEVIHDHGFKELRDPGDIPQLTIDSVWELGSWNPPGVISIDVEGSEGRVLRGAIETLKRFKPAVFLSLHPEFLHDQYGEWGAELRKWIIDLGYKETLLDYPLHEVHLMYEASNV